MSVSDYLSFVPIFSELDDLTLEKIVNIGTQKIFEKNEVILLEEVTGTALFYKEKFNRDGLQ